MTWEELCDKAKEMGYELYCEDGLCYLENKNIDLSFFEDGQIEYMYGGVISEDRTPEQMYQIMKALK